MGSKGQGRDCGCSPLKGLGDRCVNARCSRYWSIGFLLMEMMGLLEVLVLPKSQNSSVDVCR